MPHLITLPGISRSRSTRGISQQWPFSWYVHTRLPKAATGRKGSLASRNAGTVGLVFNDAAGLALWSGRFALKAAEPVDIDLPVGPHTITVRIDTGKRTAPLRIGLPEVAGSPGRARIVTGK